MKIKKEDNKSSCFFGRTLTLPVTVNVLRVRKREGKVRQASR